MRQEGKIARIWVGSVIAIFGSILTYAVFPLNFVRDWRLSGSATVEGVVTDSTETRLTVDDLRVWRHDFHYTLEGRVYEGRCYTTGNREFGGRNVAVQYLPGDPAIARIVGTRSSLERNSGLFLLLLPLFGVIMLVGGLCEQRQGLWLLKHGRFAAAWVESVERTGSDVNYQPEYAVVLRLTDLERKTTVTLRCHTPEVVTFAETRLQSGQHVAVLYDPKDPLRILMPEALL